MSSIGEGIDFSQEQQKISGIVPSSHFPCGTQTFGSFLAQVFFPLTQKTDMWWVREVSLSPHHAPAVQNLRYLYGPPSCYFRRIGGELHFRPTY